MNKKKITLLCFALLCLALLCFVLLANRKVSSEDAGNTMRLSIREKVERQEAGEIYFIKNGFGSATKYEIIEHKYNDLEQNIYVVTDFIYKNKLTVEYNVYVRHNLDEDYNSAKRTSFESGLSYEQTIAEIQKQDPRTLSKKEFENIYKTEHIDFERPGTYLGQDIRNLTKGLPAVVWRAWSPNYKNLVYVYKNEISLDRKNPPEFGTRVFIENGDEDLVFNNTVPFSYFPEFPDGFYDFNPIIFINDQEFYFIAQNNWGAENKGKFASDQIKSLTENGEEILAGVYAFNAETLEYRLIDKLPATGRKYKYITYENKMYVYGGDLENVRVYNNNGELEKTLEYNGRERDLAVITFINWGTRVEDGIKKDIAMFENNDVTNYVEGISIVLE